MRLNGSTGDYIDIAVARYQFPDKWDNEYDANWLLIDTSASVAGREWSTRDACLLTWEVEWLASWLEDVARGTAGEAESSFLEPNLRFELCGERVGWYHVRCYFELENRPRWAPSDGAPMDDLWIDLNCTETDLLAAVADLRAQRARFPTRGGVGDTRDKPGGQA
jgi:hypothetical protein